MERLNQDEVPTPRGGKKWAGVGDTPRSALPLLRQKQQRGRECSYPCKGEAAAASTRPRRDPAPLRASRASARGSPSPAVPRCFIRCPRLGLDDLAPVPEATSECLGVPPARCLCATSSMQRSSAEPVHLLARISEVSEVDLSIETPGGTRARGPLLPRAAADCLRWSCPCREARLSPPMLSG